MPSIISTVRVSHMAEPRVTAEGDYPKDVDTGRLKQIGSYYIHYVPANVLSPGTQ